MKTRLRLAAAAGLVITSAPGAGQAQGEIAITPIPGIIAAAAQFTQVFQTVGNNVDGIVAAADGSLLASQEDNNAVLKIDKDTERRCCSPVSRWGRCRSIDRAASSPSGASRSKIGRAHV